MGLIKNLYEISGKAAVLKKQLELMDVEEDVKQDTLDAMFSSVSGKDLEGLANWLHELEQRERNLDEDIKTLRTEKKHTQAIEGAIKHCLLDYMVTTDKQNITFDNSPIRLHKNKGIESVYIPDENKLAVDYFRTKTEYVPDKARIKEDLKRGKEVLGAELVRKPTVNLK